MSAQRKKPLESSSCDALDGARWQRFAEQLLLARNRRRLTLKDVSSALGLADGHLSAIESGKTPNPGIQTVFRLAEFYGISLDALTGLESQPATSQSARAVQLMDNEMDDAGRDYMLKCIEGFAFYTVHRPPVPSN